ncbi:MAG: hypothetical protein ACLU80_06065 [Dorea sp.]
MSVEVAKCVYGKKVGTQSVTKYTPEAMDELQKSLKTHWRRCFSTDSIKALQGDRCVCADREADKTER